MSLPIAGHPIKIFLLTVFLVSLGVTSEAEEPQPSAKHLYHDYCSVCHGDKGDGDSRAKNSFVPPPRSFTTPQAASDLTKERMLLSIREGRPGTAMPPWKNQLADEQITSIANYIRNVIMMPIASEDASRAQHLYATNCSVCHGDDGSGARWTKTNFNPPPRNFTHPSARAELSRDYMLHVVNHGKPDTAMPGFATQLTLEDIAVVVDYVWSTFIPTAPLTDPDATDIAESRAPQSDEIGAGGVVNMNATMPNDLVGDSRLGMALYFANCSACHGNTGNGQGPRAYFILPKPRNFQHPGSRSTFNRPALYRAIARGKLGAEMPAWDTVLTDQDIANVTEYVFQSFIRTETAEASP